MTTLLLEKLSSKDPKIKYGYLKVLLQTAEERPAQLLPQMETWGNMLHSSNKIFKWTAIEIIGYLAACDEGQASSDYFDELVHILHNGELIEVGHAIAALARIGRHHPGLTSEVISKLLKVPEKPFKSETCRDIAIGKVLDALTAVNPDMLSEPDVNKFIAKQAKSSKKSLATRAKRLAKRIPA